MIVLPGSRLVVLEVPKTGTVSLRQMLRPHADLDLSRGPRHVSHEGYVQRHADRLFLHLGGPARTVCVVRDPLRRMQSWYRYRLRDGVTATRITPREVGFEGFMRAYLAPDPPPFARIGRQDVFCGWDGRRAAVDHVFDYRFLDVAVEWLSARIGQPLRLPRRNASRPAGEELIDYTLSDATLARFQEVHEAEFAFYMAVRRAVHLRRPRAKSPVPGTPLPDWMALVPQAGLRGLRAGARARQAG